jgi:hypothetical protein
MPPRLDDRRLDFGRKTSQNSVLDLDLRPSSAVFEPPRNVQLLGSLPGMVFEHIEKLKREWTDKFVVADTTRPELARFRDMTGRVKTVNMNGRALVEFDANDNIGWYDVALDFLKIVDGPQPKAARAATPRAMAAEAKPTPAAKPPVGAKKASTADILAAARAGKPAAAAESSAKKLSTADILAAARGKSAGTSATAPNQPAGAKTSAAATPGKKLSTADILAAARAGKTATAEPEPPAAKPETAAETAPNAAAPEVEQAVRAPKVAAGGPLPKTTSEILAYCRRVDSRG